MQHTALPPLEQEVRGPTPLWHIHIVAEKTAFACSSSLLCMEVHRYSLAPSKDMDLI